MGLFGKIFGFEFNGKVVAVCQIAERTSPENGVRKWHHKEGYQHQTAIEITPGGRLKGYKQNGFAFNREDYPPVYKVFLEQMGKRREFVICTDSPPEIGSVQTYPLARKTIFYC